MLPVPEPKTPPLAPLPWLPITRLPWWTCALLMAALVTVDFLTGPYYQFPSSYFLFIMLITWFNGVRAGLLMSLVLPFTRVALMEWYWHQPWQPSAYFATAFTRVVSWSALTFIVGRLADHERLLRDEVTTLISLLPVCADCHRIRSEDEHWQDLTSYASEHAEQFAPALCPSCARSRLPEHVPPGED